MRSWIYDEEENLINLAWVRNLCFDDRGPDYLQRYRILAITGDGEYEFVLFSSSDIKETKALYYEFKSDIVNGTLYS